jgi:hypothetical protein
MSPRSEGYGVDIVLIIVGPGTAPTVKNTSFTITAKLNAPERSAEGVILLDYGDTTVLAS